MIFITAKFRVRPEHADRWADLTRGFTEATRAEPGNLWFDWSRSLDDPTEYVLVEAFRDGDAGAAHVQSGVSGSLRRRRGFRVATGVVRASGDTRRPLMQIADLPYIDEHATTVHASVDEVWACVRDVIDGTLSGPAGSVYARVVGCADATESGPRPLAEGSTIPGFRVTAATDRELVLEGRHRFSTYALIFRIDAAGEGVSRLRAESRAAFPGVAGSVYRLLVIGTRGHVLAVRRLLAIIKRHAERSSVP